jgi:hypothetical protein
MNSTASLRSELTPRIGQATTERPSRLRTIARSMASSAVSVIDRSEALTMSFCSAYLTAPISFITSVRSTFLLRKKKH